MKQLLPALKERASNSNQPTKAGLVLLASLLCMASAAEGRQEGHGINSEIASVHSPRADISFAVGVHLRAAPAAELGSWVRVNLTRDWLVSGHTEEHKSCLKEEHQGDCHAQQGQGPRESSRSKFKLRSGAKLLNSPGALAGRVDFAWRATPAAADMYQEWAGSRAELIHGLERVLGANGRIIVFGDSLSRQFTKTLSCTLTHKLGMENRTKYVKWGMGGKLGHRIGRSDVLVLNFGHWLQHGQHANLTAQHDALRSGWKSAFQSLIEQKVDANRVFVRTSQTRFVLAGSPGEWNTKSGMLCGGTAPNLSAAWSDFTTVGQHVQPAENIALLEILRASPYQLFDIAPITLSRSDTTFDCSHDCLPGVQDTWASILFQRLINMQLEGGAGPVPQKGETGKTAAALLRAVPSLRSAGFSNYREFPTWSAYYAWRDAQIEWQPTHPCVRENTSSYKCLPKLIIIGAFKGGTTGVRHKLLASGQFVGPKIENHWFGEREFPTSLSREKEAARYAMHVPEAVFMKNEFVVFESNPRYVDILNTRELKFIKRVNPDAHMLLLARPGSDIWFSGLGITATDYQDCDPFNSYGHDCSTGVAQAAHEARNVFDEGSQRAMAMERDWEHRDVISTEHRAGTYVAKGGFFYALRHLWHTWPREQTLVLESMAVWQQPRKSYDALAHALRLNFTISLVANTRTRPNRQDDSKCPKAKLQAMKQLISKCDLKMPFRCAWYSANKLLANLLETTWPLAWNDGVNQSICDRHGFLAKDLSADFTADSDEEVTIQSQKTVTVDDADSDDDDDADDAE